MTSAGTRLNGIKIISLGKIKGESSWIEELELRGVYPNHHY